MSNREKKVSLLHRRVVAAAAAEAGLDYQVGRLARDPAIDDDHARILDAEGTVLWTVHFKPNGQFHWAHNKRSTFIPDYRKYSYTSTPREALDFWLTHRDGLGLDSEGLRERLNSSPQEPAHRA